MVKLFGKYEYPEGLYYSKDHLWAKVEGENVRVGITDFAQQLAGRIRFVRLRPPGREVKRGGALGTMETGKWVGPLKSPVSGVIMENNRNLRRKASLMNDDPYGEGWISIIKPSNLEEELKDLMVDIDDLKKWLEKEIAKYSKEK